MTIQEETEIIANGKVFRTAGLLDSGSAFIEYKSTNR